MRVRALISCDRPHTIGVLLSPSPAHATSLDLTCAGTETAGYQPGLLLTAQQTLSPSTASLPRAYHRTRASSRGPTFSTSTPPFVRHRARRAGRHPGLHLEQRPDQHLRVQPGKSTTCSARPRSPSPGPSPRAASPRHRGRAGRVRDPERTAMPRLARTHSARPRRGRLDHRPFPDADRIPHQAPRNPGARPSWRMSRSPAARSPRCQAHTQSASRSRSDLTCADSRALKRIQRIAPRCSPGA